MWQIQSRPEIAVAKSQTSESQTQANPIPNSTPKGHITGADVSHHNLDIDWPRVPRNGIHFLFVKATEGLDYLDPKFNENFEGAKRVGLITGAYHFFVTLDSGADQAKNFMDNVHLVSGDLPPVIDFEVIHPNTSLDYKREFLDCLKTLEQHYGVKPIIYTSHNFWSEHMQGDAALAHYPLWLAAYTDQNPPIPTPWNEYTFWQCTPKAHDVGIPTPADQNLFRGSMDTLKQMCLP